VANSRATAQELTGFGLDPASALVLTPCPDPSLLQAGMEVDARAAHDLVGKKVLLSVGRFVPRKGFDRLIRLLPELRKTCGDVVLVLAGAGAEEGRLRDEGVRSGVSAQVRFVVAPDRVSLAALYRAADLFALAVRPSTHDVEGFGLVFLEAALFGLPSVSTRCGGVPEAVEDDVTGLLADPESESDLYEKLRRLLLDADDAARLGRAARDRATSGFRWPARAEAFLRRLA
jgi:phosphatidylinositol alpha-1,6-mannosyltransferase